MTQPAIRADSTGDTARAANKRWHYIPEVPLRVSPLFRIPLQSAAIGKWIVGGWFPPTERLIILLLAAVSWFFFHPALMR